MKDAGKEKTLSHRAMLCAVAALLSLAAWILRRALCPQLDTLLPLGALLLIPTAALYAELLFQKRRELSGSEKGTGAEE